MLPPLTSNPPASAALPLRRGKPDSAALPLRRGKPGSAAWPLRRGKPDSAALPSPEYPISSAIHRTVCASISVAIGDRFHDPQFWLTALARKSPSAPIGAGLDVM